MKADFLLSCRPILNRYLLTIIDF